GMPDGWENRYFGSPTAGDPAGHGDDDTAPNLDEFNGDTDPTDGTSYLRIVGMETFDFLVFRVAEVTFPSSAYRQYRVEHANAPGLVTNGWTAGTSGYEEGTGGDMDSVDILFTDVTGALFRVRGKLP
ncbi:MAG: hypothetical protein KKC51_01060, partial [Verrucomicrobia bacterium]|nr:hypothetical protein [Verrucomicrobiota bacterium]